MAYKRFTVTAPSFATKTELADAQKILDARVTDVGEQLLKNGLTDEQQAKAIDQLTDSIAKQGSELVARVGVVESRADGFDTSITNFKNDLAKTDEKAEDAVLAAQAVADELSLLAEDTKAGFQAMGGTIN